VAATWTPTPTATPSPTPHIYSIKRGDTLLMEATDSKGWAVVSLKKPVTIDLVAMPEDVVAKLRGEKAEGAA
jgi:hypothetical protein